MKLSPSDLHGPRLGTLALSGVVVFATVCILAQFVRDDLDWMRAPLSSYLRGEYGWVVKTAYFALSAALGLLGLGYQRTLAAAARSAIPLLLFVVGGVALVVTALADSGSRFGAHALESFVHNLSAAIAFLCVTMAMLLQAWWFRVDEAWRQRFALAFTLAVVCFIALLWYAFLVDHLRGLVQKAVIAMIVSWLALASSWLRVPMPALSREQGIDEAPP
jgi:hypothetical protein